MTGKVVLKSKLSKNYFLVEIEAPKIAEYAQPGQFVMIHTDEKSRGAYLIASTRKNIISVVADKTHKEGKLLSTVRKGQKFTAVQGPLGKALPMDHYGNVCIVAEGEGVAPAIFLALALKQFENRVTFIAGYQKEDDVYWEDRVGDIANKHAVAIADKKARVDPLISAFHNMIRRKQMNLVISVCNVHHMEEVANLTQISSKNLSLLTPIIYDGIGMCGTCRVPVDGEMKLACQEGPALDGCKIDWAAVKHRYKQMGRTR